MENREKTPVAILTELLAEMTERAMEAERQRDAAKEDAQNWYVISCSREERLKVAEDKLAKEIEAHRQTRNTLCEFVGVDSIDDAKRGELTNA